MASKFFKAKLIGSEVLRALKERQDNKTDLSYTNPELTKAKNAVCDRLQQRLVDILEKPAEDEGTALIGPGGQAKSNWGDEQRKLTEFDEIYAAVSEALDEYRAIEKRHMATPAIFGAALERQLAGLRELKQQVDAERSSVSCPCALL